MKPLREGFTTGSCAAAAALASCLWIRDGECPATVEIVVPEGRVFHPEIVKRQYPRCGVVKDAGDDPDVTDGMEVTACVSIHKEPGEIRFIAGEGVGVVTLPGLKLPVGEAAVNPVPREMIERAIRSVFNDLAADVEIAIPEGGEVAKRTFNPRLGIEGGLSVLGTTGIVRPMSEDAIRETIALEMKMRRAQGETRLIFTFGNQGEAALRGITDDPIVQMSNYVGFSLDTARKLGFQKLTIAGNPGKLVKVAGGVMNTHSGVADARREVLMAHLALSGAPNELVREVYALKTVDAAIPLIRDAGFERVWDSLADAVSQYCEARIFREIPVDALFIGSMEGILGKSGRLRADG